jgi:hypothetical protein
MQILDEEVDELQETYGFNDIVRSEKYQVLVYFPNYLLIFNLTPNYPKEIPKIEVFNDMDQMEELLTKKIQESAIIFAGYPMMEAVIRYAEEILPKPKKKTNNVGKVERIKNKQKEIEIFFKAFEIKKSKEIENFIEALEIKKSIETPKTNDNFISIKDVNDAVNCSGAPGSILELIQNLERNIESRDDKLFILSSIKSISNRSLQFQHLQTIFDIGAHLDVLKVIRKLNSEEWDEDVFANEILIYSTFIIFKIVSEIPQTRFQLLIDFYQILWGLGKRKKNQVRKHVNDIISIIGKEKGLTSDLFVSFQNSDFCDFKIICSSDEIEFLCHKCILSVRCKDIDLSKDVFILNSTVESALVKKFLVYVYSGSSYFNFEEIERSKDLFEYLIHPFDHKENSKDFQSDIKSIFYSENLYSDLRISTMKSDGEIVEFKVNKSILCCRSEYFNKMLHSGLSESSQDVITGDFSFDIMKYLLDFIYTGSLDGVKLDNSNAIDMLIASDMYMLQSLKLSCEKTICTMIEKSNFVDLWNFSEDYNCEFLQNYMDDGKTRWK